MYLYAFLNIILLLICGAIKINAQCGELGDKCSEDCDCCGWPEDRYVRCELRSQARGLRCHLSKHVKQPCNGDSECASQYCKDGYCAHKFKNPPPKRCPLEIADIEAVKGRPIEEDGTCPCDDPEEPTHDDVSLAVDGKLSTVYVNNYGLDMGIVFYTTDAAPISNMTVCSADDCTECDPTCYKLEGFCEETQQLVTIQSGDLDFKKRNECIDIPVTKRGLYSYFTVTFPCQRGGFSECGSGGGGGEGCQCDNGIIPFEPKVKAPGPCRGKTPIASRRLNRYRLSDKETIYALPSVAKTLSLPTGRSLQVKQRDSSSNLRPGGLNTRVAQTDRPAISYLSSSKNGEYTEILYYLTNVHGFKTNFYYAMLQWGGGCCFDCFNVFFDLPANGKLDPDDEECSKSCEGARDLEGLFYREADPILCMEGLKLYNNDIFGNKSYIFKVLVKGDVKLEKKPYGLAFGIMRQTILYGEIESPVCTGCTGSTSYGEDGVGRCENYPMQVAEVSLTTKCKDIPNAK